MALDGAVPNLPEVPGIPGLRDFTVIGRGAFAVVYRARQEALDRDVAVKVSTVDVGPSAAERAAGSRRFVHESVALGRLSGHPHVLAVHATGTLDDGRPYLVLDYALRGTLHDHILRYGPLPWHQAARMGIQLAGALESAHRRGVLHRDVKPQNVLLSDTGAPLLADFGSALADALPDALPDALSNTDDGEGDAPVEPVRVVGSVPYCAPEVLDGSPATALSDVYSLAATIFFLVAGVPPFVAAPDETLAGLYLRIARDLPPVAPSSPDGLVRLLDAALAKDPAHRPGGALSFAIGLTDVLSAARRSAADLVVVPRPAAVRALSAGAGLEGRTGARRAVTPDPNAETADLSELAARWRGVRLPAARDRRSFSS
ncbi:hypothetical protein GCM10009547_27930 [Sporichthya brevicatena]|uniref:non-specific serine/threonine protein kinase n=1 Tax=Sporichthya brevicatena TaxID=171442 RepID=A0ABN1GYI7_9ACTN